MLKYTGNAITRAQSTAITIRIINLLAKLLKTYFKLLMMSFLTLLGRVFFKTKFRLLIFKLPLRYFPKCVNFVPFQLVVVTFNPFPLQLHVQALDVLLELITGHALCGNAIDNRESWAFILLFFWRLETQYTNRNNKLEVLLQVFLSLAS